MESHIAALGRNGVGGGHLYHVSKAFVPSVHIAALERCLVNGLHIIGIVHAARELFAEENLNITQFRDAAQVELHGIHLLAGHCFTRLDGTIISFYFVCT